MTEVEVDAWQCGCRTWVENDIFYIKPCGNLDCLVVKIALDESRKQGNKIEYMGIETCNTANIVPFLWLLLAAMTCEISKALQSP